jgi:hypothetical protein
MALLFLDSFDHYQAADITSKWTSSFTLAAIAAGQGRCGTNCARLGTFNDLVKGLPFGSARATLGFAFRIDGSQTLDGLTITFVRLGNATEYHGYVRWNPDGSLEVWRRADVEVSLARSAPGLVGFDHWYFVEWETLIHPTAGTSILRLNNVVIAAASGVNTVGERSLAELRRLAFTCGSNQQFFLDDLYVLDDTGPAPLNTFLGDCRVEYLRPRAPGTFQQWTPVGTATHEGAVDDNATPDKDATYIESTTPGQLDTSRYTPTGLPSGSVFGAQLSLYARKSDQGPRVIAPVANGSVGPSLTPSADTYQYFTTPYGVNPATGLAWTIAQVNAAEFGVKVVS